MGEPTLLLEVHLMGIQIVRIIFEPPFIYIVTTTICFLAGGVGYFVVRNTQVMRTGELPEPPKEEEEWKVEKK